MKKNICIVCGTRKPKKNVNEPAWEVDRVCPQCNNHPHRIGIYDWIDKLNHLAVEIARTGVNLYEALACAAYQCGFELVAEKTFRHIGSYEIYEHVGLPRIRIWMPYEEILGEWTKKHFDEGYMGFELYRDFMWDMLSVLEGICEENRDN